VADRPCGEFYGFYSVSPEYFGQKTTSRKRSKNGGDIGTGVYMREETTSRLWRPIGLMVSFMIVTASVRNISDTLSYVQIVTNKGFIVHGFVGCTHFETRYTDWQQGQHYT
jgi:hypothetical protein